MINITEVLETNKMIEEENLDVRTITLGISLLDCIDSDLETLKKNIYERHHDGQRSGIHWKTIEAQYGIPIVNKRISVLRLL